MHSQCDLFAQGHTRSHILTTVTNNVTNNDSKTPTVSNSTPMSCEWVVNSLLYTCSARPQKVIYKGGQGGHRGKLLQV